MLIATVNYLRVVGCKLVAAKEVEATGNATEVAREPLQQLANKSPKITNSTSTYATFGGA